MKSLALFISRRISATGSGDGLKACKTGSRIAVIGIALTFIIMLISIAVVTGFKHEISNKLVGFNAQLTIYPQAAFGDDGENEGLRYNDTLRAALETAFPGVDIQLAINQPVLLKTDSAFCGLTLKGYDPDASSNVFADNLIEGALPRYDAEEEVSEIIISSATAAALSLKPGDAVPAHFFRDNNIRTRKFTVSGIFDSHFGQFDKNIAGTPIAMLQNLNRIDSVTAGIIELRGFERDRLADEASNLRNVLINYILTSAPNDQRGYVVETVEESCAGYYNWLDLLDTNVVVIIILMAIVSGFTLISSLFILILERVNTIGILKAVGADNRLIRRTFIYIAEHLVVKGLLIGNLLGIVFLYLQKSLHIIPLDPQAYYLNFVPVTISWPVIIILNLCVLLFAALILILPSHLIATISPAKSIKFE